MVNKEQIVSMYRNHKETFEDEIEEMNRALAELGINCELISQVSDDGETLNFKKIDR